MKKNSAGLWSARITAVLVTLLIELALLKCFATELVNKIDYINDII